MLMHVFVTRAVLKKMRMKPRLMQPIKLIAGY